MADFKHRPSRLIAGASALLLSASTLGACTTADPAGDAQCTGVGQTCQAWYEEGNAPPGYEDVGACALPA